MPPFTAFGKRKNDAFLPDPRKSSRRRPTAIRARPSRPALPVPAPPASCDPRPAREAAAASFPDGFSSSAAFSFPSVSRKRPLSARPSSARLRSSGSPGRLNEKPPFHEKRGQTFRRRPGAGQPTRRSPVSGEGGPRKCGTDGNRHESSHLRVGGGPAGTGGASLSGRKSVHAGGEEAAVTTFRRNVPECAPVPYRA